VALAALVTPAAAQQTAPDGAVEQAVREAVRAASPDPVFILGVAAVGGFAGALLANAVWNVREGSTRGGQPGPRAGGQPRQPGQGAPQDQPLAQEPGDQQGGGPVGESAPNRDRQQ
jgi:hypothetical protein